MQTHKDSNQVTKRRHLANTIELLYQQLKSLHEMRTEHLQRQHASEWDNQLSYTKKAERELRKKHLIELKEHPKSLRVGCCWICLSQHCFCLQVIYCLSYFYLLLIDLSSFDFVFIMVILYSHFYFKLCVYFFFFFPRLKNYKSRSNTMIL